jgi:hypothetical protein
VRQNQDHNLPIFDRVKSVAPWSTNIRKLAKDHKGYGSALHSAILSWWYSRFEVTWLWRANSNSKTRVGIVYVLSEVFHGTFLIWNKIFIQPRKVRQNQDHNLPIFDRVKSVAPWSTNIRKLAKDHKGYYIYEFKKNRSYLYTHVQRN